MKAQQPDGTLEVARPPSAAGSLLVFFTLTYLGSWIFFIAASVTSRGLSPEARLGPGILALVLVGTFMPGLVALGLTERFEGRAAVHALLGRLFQWRVRARWYLFALGYIVIIKLVAALALRVATGAWPRFGEAPWSLMIAATVVSTVVGGQAGEETGWRGYALPRLAERFGLGGASVILGVIWACWHLPLFFLRGADTYGQSFPVYLLQVTALSVAIAFLYGRTAGSLLLTMLMHAAINNLKDIVPAIPRTPANPFIVWSSPVGWLALALLWMGVGYFLSRMRIRPSPHDGELVAQARAPLREA